jgi:hypothetical protein
VAIELGMKQSRAPFHPLFLAPAFQDLMPVSCSAALPGAHRTPHRLQVQCLVEEGVVVMKKLLWPVIGVFIVLWSGLAWVVHSLVGWGGHLVSSNADIVTPNPEAVEWLSWFAHSGSGIAEWLVIAVWALGVGLALLVGFASAKLLPRFGSLTQRLGTPS